MSTDPRLYARFALDFADSHKIAPLSDAAFRAYVRMVLWSRRMLTDGKIPGPMALVLAGKPKVLAELTTNDPVSPSLQKVGDDYWIHDFLEHQPSRAQIEARQAVNRANGARGGQAKAKRLASDSLTESPSDGVANFYTESETETTTGVNGVGPVSETGDPARTDGLQSRAETFGFDADRVRQELTRVLGQFPDADTVMRVAVAVLGKASRPADNPTAYLVSAIRKSEFEVQRIAYGGAA